MESRESLSVDEEVAALSRSADRDSLFMQANLLLPGQPTPLVVRVRNLSAGGMLAEAVVRGVVEGAAVEVELRNVGFVPGRVVWVGEGKFGIAFDHVVDPQAVRRQVVQKMEVPPHISALDRPSYRRR
ncbi:pilus assembly protein PilZ [Sphingopyxis lindanitolerans]|uniref:Pilus assembly protein PilZ n=1 Tax=Sphingopyxis lindanitolerans TaxID=2054227 RepID=A0A2S8B649_9SPHN|nr:PilZ domain-containing protein [Sphingopyxis lindanitolerans]PQM27813.1 pilus assembly protein PilZ [Sphingopyxis lindanitolerans]